MSKLFFSDALLSDGWGRDVTLEIDAGGWIISVTPDSDPDDCEQPGGVAIPGLSNLHSHAFQRAMAGLGERRGPAGTSDSFWSWREVMYRFLGALTPEQVEAIAAFLYAEMLEAGYTAVAEFHYLHHDPAGQPYDDLAEMAGRIAAAAHDSGIGLTLLPVFYHRGGFGGQEANPGQRRFLNDAARYLELRTASEKHLGALPHARLGTAPHSLRAVTLEELAEVLEFSSDGPQHIHIAEQTKEVEDCQAWSGKRPVELLAETQELSDRWTLIHATHITTEERQAIGRAGAVAGLCPITEANLGDGVYPATDFLEDGGRFGIGTDSNIQIDAAAELRQLEYSQRLRDRRRALIADPEGSTGRRLLASALTGGAQALDRPGGALAPGKLADIVALDDGHPDLLARSGDLWLDGWIFSAGKQAVRHVWSAGRQQVRDGRHANKEALSARYAAALESLMRTA